MRSTRDFRSSRHLRLDSALTPLEPARPLYRLGLKIPVRSVLSPEPVPSTIHPRPGALTRLWRAILRLL